ncbi:ABC-three component system protein [Archangium violaceum]|uniref:ABC-three component system protein n=1 Tax=Archangium violaceum TaxID=83451 RepID=UPI0009498667|nr:ABC-three component system protein [Archangium violaceum]
MIRAIESSIPTFKPVRFHAGFNVLLADTRPDSTLGQTRNSAGKTSLVEIVHFLLGANVDKDSLFKTAALVGHTFYGDFLIGGESIRVARTGLEPSRFFLLNGSASRFPLSVKVEKGTGREYVSQDSWRSFLGHKMFDLPLERANTIYDESFTPSFRSMFSYFARRRSTGGFLNPEKQSTAQQRSDYQVNLSYLLGLDWRIPHEFEKVRVRERTLTELKKAAKGGALGAVLGTAAELRPQVTIAETRAQKLREQLANFEVLDSYRDLSRRAAKAKTDMQAIGREVVSLHESREHLERSLEAEQPPAKSDLERLYAAVGLELPGVALRRFADVDRFYESVIGNRRSHLRQEIEDVRARIADGELRMAKLDTERSELLRALEGRGALEDFLKLQGDLATLEASAAALRERFKAAEMLEGEATKLDIDRINLKRRLQEDHQQRYALIDEAIIIIADAIAALYDDRAGRFIIDATDNGPEFRISIEGDRGGGISNMEIFCLDLALMRLVGDRLGGPGFLIHDSHLFDGVDPRQVARALVLGAQVAESRQQQYIVTMNSDIFGNLPLPSELDLQRAVLPTRLSDETDTGGLFGFRFE